MLILKTINLIKPPVFDKIMALVYSCCFWFSLRLGGLLIGLFSLAILILYVCCWGYNNTQTVKNEINYWTDNIVLSNAKIYLDNIAQDPQKYFSLGIGGTCLYIIACIVFIYGAYTCNNMLMVTYIILELLRLILISMLVATCLLLIKQNTMDIGILIGTSVAGGFLLLGMFYLWICTANLPLVITEVEHEDQAFVIAQLRKVLEINNPRPIPQSFGSIPFASGPNHIINGRPKDVFMVPMSTNKRTVNKKLKSPQRIQARIPKPIPWQH